MILKFFGADKEVTGSCHYLEVNGRKLLIDCGLQQGQDEQEGENEHFPFSPGELDAVFVTHAHIDHSGRLPMLIKNGYRGPIYATRMTCELLKIMLEDSAHIQEMEAKWKQRKHRRSGDELEDALYTIQDAEKTFDYLVPCEYHQHTKVFDGIEAEWVDAGHLLGSASIRFTLKEKEQTRTIVFSGDIGNYHQPIIRDPEYFTSADYVVMESTYGDRLHEETDDLVWELSHLIEETLLRGGNVVIPSFAVGRTQELLYFIREMKERNLVKRVPDFPVYVDSPLALEATQIYDGDLTGYADAETIAVLESGYRPISFPNLHLCRTAEESIALNADLTPKVIISSSGMCEAGRIRHHLKHNLWRQECSIVFVGFQAYGSLGRKLIDGVESVKLFGEPVAVKAQIHNFRGMSGHADREGLLEWIGAYQCDLSRVFVVHGEQDICENFTRELCEQGFPAWAPEFEGEYDLIANKILYAGVPQDVSLREKRKKSTAVYDRLEQAGDRILAVIRHNQGGSNKDLRKFTEQLLALAEKWDR